MNTIELAREAGFTTSRTEPLFTDMLDRFAALVRAEVLEEAAELADWHKDDCHEGAIDWYEAKSIAAAIRQLKEIK